MLATTTMQTQTQWLWLGADNSLARNNARRAEGQPAPPAGASQIAGPAAVTGGSLRGSLPPTRERDRRMSRTGRPGRAAEKLSGRRCGGRGRGHCCAGPDIATFGSTQTATKRVCSLAGKEGSRAKAYQGGEGEGGTQSLTLVRASPSLFSSPPLFSSRSVPSRYMGVVLC